MVGRGRGSHDGHIAVGNQEVQRRLRHDGPLEVVLRVGRSGRPCNRLHLFHCGDDDRPHEQRSRGLREEAVFSARGDRCVGAGRDDEAEPRHRWSNGHHRCACPRRGHAVGGGQGRFAGGFRVAQAAPVLLEGRRHVRPRGHAEEEHQDGSPGGHRELRSVVRLRVSGQHRPLGDHAADRQVLPDAHGRVRAVLRGRTRGSGGHGQDGEHKGLGQGAGHPVRRVQL
mmetsp:Transcript_66771/g.204344  ORF Transcript_66771/g.204344 Transcript_66771/m.204344 type:complete len:226 (+) Transcript_66771:5384-6061(+)